MNTTTNTNDKPISILPVRNDDGTVNQDKTQSLFAEILTAFKRDEETFDQRVEEVRVKLISEPKYGDDRKSVNPHWTAQGLGSLAIGALSLNPSNENIQKVSESISRLMKADRKVVYIPRGRYAGFHNKDCYSGDALKKLLEAAATAEKMAVEKANKAAAEAAAALKAVEANAVQA
jgi:hypothetical protein